MLYVVVFVVFILYCVMFLYINIIDILRVSQLKNQQKNPPNIKSLYPTHPPVNYTGEPLDLRQTRRVRHVLLNLSDNYFLFSRILFLTFHLTCCNACTCFFGTLLLLSLTTPAMMMGHPPTHPHTPCSFFPYLSR